MMAVITRRVIKLGTLAILLVGLSCVAPTSAQQGVENRMPDLGDYQHLRVPDGHQVAFHAYAEGVQIYRWNGTKWDFVGPEAVLYAPAGADGVVGIHYAGPTWESNSGSLVVGKVLDRGTPDPSAIPWLKLEAIVTIGPGIFDGVTYIQRVNTVGGLSPADPGEFTDEIARVPYAADYYFYRQHQ